MAELKTGTVSDWRPLSAITAIFRLRPQAGSGFPEYKAGQYMALRREGCRLTRRIMGQDGRPHFAPVLDETGHQKVGPVTHSYSISSAPWETAEQGYIEFFVVLETDEEGHPGRLTESLFHIKPGEDDQLEYVNRIVGDFTLDKRAAGFASVLMVGTGTGVAPFASMLKQLHRDASGGSADKVRYTLLQANRSAPELGYHDTFREIEAAGKLDFVYVPSVSRPAPQDREAELLGIGRANNLLRHVFEMPMKEEAAVELESEAGRAALEAAVRPKLPARLSAAALRERLEPSQTVILTCGNPSLMADIKTIAEVNWLRFEKEDW